MNYELTNESIPAVISGLNLQLEDKVLAVGGSGDVAFAMCEFSNNILVVDDNKDQIRYIQKRKDYLKNKDLTNFLNLGFFYKDRYQFDLSESTNYRVKSRQEYFENKRFNKVCERVNEKVNLSFNTQNIFETKCFREGFNKIYLSNCLTYISSNSNEITENLKKISDATLKGGLIYVSDFHKILKEFPQPKRLLASAGLILHSRMSEKAREFQFEYNRLSRGSGIYWFPAVFKKV